MVHSRAAWRLLAVPVVAWLSACGGGERVESDAPIISLELQPRDLDVVIEELVQRLKKRAADGWPSTIVLDAEQRPALAIGHLENRTAAPLDMTAYAERIRAALARAGTVRPLPAGEQPSAESPGLELSGSITQETIRQEKIEQRDYHFLFVVDCWARPQRIATVRQLVRKVGSQE